jgi:tellurite resistance protein TehA-like permease
MHIRRLTEALEQFIKNIFPGYFALVMATGIVSIASHLLGMGSLAWFLLYVNLIAYGILWLLFVARLLWFSKPLIDDLVDHSRGPGFFTLIAGTCVLGSQLDLVAGDTAAATYLFYLGVGLWILIMYIFFTAVTVNNPKPTIEEGLNGAWLIAIVATQSISILGTVLSSRFPSGEQVMLFFSLGMYLFGLMLYLLVIGLIFYRWIFINLKPEELTPPYWINMGAVAITTLAGDTIILHASQWGFLRELLPFLKGMTLFSWAAATWWIPLLFIVGAWRHIYKQYPLSYNPQYWGMVFPLGMYTTCTHQLAMAMGIEFVNIIPEYFIYVALIAWAATFLGLLVSIFEGFYVNGFVQEPG